MRIYKKHPFSSPNSMRINRAATECDRVDSLRKDLLNIRKRIADGTMTKELYDFINMDGSLENILLDLPEPVEEVGCEALTNAQLTCIDAALESVNKDERSMLRKLWDIFKEWWLDWFDVNRLARIKLKEFRAKFVMNPNVCGDVEEYEGLSVLCYKREHWVAMKEASKYISNIIKTIPSSNYAAWYESNKDALNKHFAEFGRVITAKGSSEVKNADGALKIEQRSAKYVAAVGPLGSAMWTHGLILVDIDAAMSVLKDDVSSRQLFRQIEHVFTTATPEDKDWVDFFIKLVKESAKCALVTASALSHILYVAHNRARAKAVSAAAQ